MTRSNDEAIRTTRLPNGILVLTETIPTVETVALGIWADAGTVDESPEEYGLAHFLEHMLFKGTETRSAFALAEEIEDVGGQLNAYTEMEITNLSARVLAEHLPVAIELLSDMVCHSTFPVEEIERERQVVVEEINKYEALPDERIHDLLMEGLWHGGALGHPILGYIERIPTFTREDLLSCWRRHFAAERLVISAAGKIDHDDFIAQLTPAFTDLPADTAYIVPQPTGERIALNVSEEDEEQVTFAWGGRTFPARDDRNFALAMVDAILGASTTSRLFQEIREKRGLAYDMGSFTVGFRETGLICATGATSPKAFPEVLTLVKGEITALRDKGITPKELTRAKEQMKAGMALALEGTVDRMRRLAIHHLTWGEIYPIGWLIERMNQVTLDEVQHVLDTVLDVHQWTFAAIGPLNMPQLEEILAD